ncbi:sialidase family protein [Flavobacterium mesophilum]|uniref:sialidase family protein n=1 Tax=Flavobacterium mesophilum TaxID=3143495 RepID=UPI0031E22F38
MRKILPVFFVFFVLFFSFCSSEKDPVSNTGKPPVDTTNPEDTTEKGFTLLPKNLALKSDLYLEGGILLDQNDNPKYNISGRTWQGIPSIGKDNLGYLYAAWVTGGKGEGNDNYLTLSLSKDKGRTWSNDKLVIYVNPEDSTRVADPCFFNDKFGNLYMAWHKYVQKKENLKKEWAIVWYSKLEFSEEDNTIHFTPPRRIAEGSMLNKPFYSEASGQFFFPIARWYEGDALLHRPFIYSASYGEHSLVNFSKIGFIPVNPDIMGIHEHMIVQLKDQSFLGMVRTFDGIYYSKSKDGAIWDMSKKFTDLGSTTVARFHLGKLKSGRLILIFNNATTRSNLVIFLSEDDGVTWPYKMTINGGNHVSYPDMIETEPGVLNIVHDFSRNLVGTIQFIEVHEDMIIKGSYGGVFRSKISSLK